LTHSKKHTIDDMADAKESADDDKMDHNVEGEDEDDEEDLEALQKEIARMEEEAARISKEAEEIGGAGKKSKAAGTDGDNKSSQEQMSNDACSIYVGQVDYSTTPEELVEHFKPCGALKRVTIVVDKYTAQPKGASVLVVFFSFFLDRKCTRLVVAHFSSFSFFILAGFAYIEFEVL
jgi:RNA recognition motif-containing protein